MKQDKMLAQMKAATNAVYLREHAKVKPILDREAQLRGKLAMLKQKFRAMDKLRHAFGRKHAVETMENQHKSDAKERRNKMLFDRLMNLD